MHGTLCYTVGKARVSETISKPTQNVRIVNGARSQGAKFEVAEQWPRMETTKSRAADSRSVVAHEENV